LQKSLADGIALLGIAVMTGVRTTGYFSATAALHVSLRANWHVSAAAIPSFY